MIKEIAFTAYAVNDINKARAFYEKVLGLVPNTTIKEGEVPHWIEYTIAENTFAIGCSPNWPTSEDGASIAFEVDNFDGYVATLKEKGILFKLEPQDYSSCKMAVILDPDKNKLLIHQRKSK